MNRVLTNQYNRKSARRFLEKWRFCFLEVMMVSPPFCAIKLYRVTDVPEMRAHFDEKAQGTVIIRVLGDKGMWVWSALYNAIGILYSITAKVEVSEIEVLLLANEY